MPRWHDFFPHYGMKASTFIFACMTSLAIYSCQDDADDTKAPEGGAEQIEAPVHNSGAETERDRALDAVQQDTSNTEVHVGKDPDEGKPKQRKDSSDK